MSHNSESLRVRREEAFYFVEVGIPERGRTRKLRRIRQVAITTTPGGTPALHTGLYPARVQWLKLPAWKIGHRGFEPHSGL